MPELLKNGFQLIFFSDVKYKILTVEIQYNEQQFAQLSVDKGPENVEIEIFEFAPHVFPVDDFLYALQTAKKRAIELYHNTTESKENTPSTKEN